MKAIPAPPVPKHTELYAPQMALKFINQRLEITDSWLNRKFNLSRKTLMRIRKGERIPRAYEDIMRALITVLNDCRFSRPELSAEIEHLLVNLLLVHNDIPTDEERKCYEKRLFIEQIKTLNN